jgi:hypothetical protein
MQRHATIVNRSRTIRVEPGTEFWISPGYQGLFTIVFFAMIGAVLHRWRTA